MVKNMVTEYAFLMRKNFPLENILFTGGDIRMTSSMEPEVFYSKMEISTMVIFFPSKTYYF